jgi:hypothetical protein
MGMEQMAVVLFAASTVFVGFPILWDCGACLTPLHASPHRRAFGSTPLWKHGGHVA